jgi:two-component system, NarL family, response regulator LiaR
MSLEREPETRDTTRVLIVEDYLMVRSGIAMSLLAFEDLKVVGQATTGEEAVQLTHELEPHVVLMDLIMPGMGGVAAIRALRETAPQVQVLALTSYQTGDLVQEALQAGALGYLLKDIEAAELGKAIRLARQGIPTLAHTAAQALVQTVATRPPGLGQDLTEREREVLVLVTEGLSNGEIADRLVVTPTTVKFHIHNLRAKLFASSRTELVILALRNHLVSAD